ncbi:MAG: PTS transporter subunit EIIC [Coriobacteriales bacterium]|nr:PTS transporter subunit EIIC [Coriobacteriales bacterium]
MGIKLPDSVPSMVTDSLAPTFVAMLTFTGAFIVKWAFSLTPFGSFYAFFNSVVSAPIMSFGASPAAIIVVYTFSNLLWFFGIHPAAILNVYSPAIITATMGNIQAFMAGTPSAELPYLEFSAVSTTLTIGGSGVMIGLAIAMLTAKSDRYKSLSKISFIPSLVNISEPMVFGTPVVLNPLFFFPLVLSVPIVGGVAWLLCNLGLANGFNPMISLPWIMPWPITNFMQGGIGFCAIGLISIVLSTALYFPFFKVADSMALKEEQEAKEAQAA